MAPKAHLILGWTAVGVSLASTCFWAFWGSIEAFWEGWYFRSIWENLALTLAQYVSPMLVFMLAALYAIRWAKIGALVHMLVAAGAVVLFRWRGPGLLLVALPLALLGLAYYFGRPEPRRYAVRAMVLLPTLTAIGCGAYPAYVVATRISDNNYGMRTIQGNGVRLRWAPRGPGWPDKDANCEHLTPDGLSLADAPQGVWHLPTAEEAVRSMTLHGVNVDGEWDPVKHQAKFRRTPDKEPPLWDPYSPVIYWWTATEINSNLAIRLAYNGKTPPTLKRFGATYYGFRCVAEPLQ